MGIRISEPLRQYIGRDKSGQVSQSGSNAFAFHCQFMETGDMHRVNPS